MSRTPHTVVQTLVQTTTARPPELLTVADGYSLHRRAAAHAPALNALVRANLDHLRPWMPWAGHAPDPEATLAMVRAGDSAWQAGTDFLYVLVPDAEPTAVVGAFGLHGRVGPGTLEIGYWTDAGHGGRGLATAAARALTAAVLALPGITRAEIHCDEANTRSAAVPRRLGYRLDRTDAAPVSAPGETGRKMIWVQDRAPS
ncbi:GNAT family N-acetyltransferase [Kitasatospora herbaricolor]|uniref:GNAT family N-acetyltransferase n=1 Tax=Kitasatospora herbaricolor TaxID=68217 RepID=UPI002E37942B|nr:GNAT family protein [Kitasatospora herbaricolor]